MLVWRLTRSRCSMGHVVLCVMSSVSDVTDDISVERVTQMGGAVIHGSNFREWVYNIQFNCTLSCGVSTSVIFINTHPPHGVCHLALIISSCLSGATGAHTRTPMFKQFLTTHWKSLYALFKTIHFNVSEERFSVLSSPTRQELPHLVWNERRHQAIVQTVTIVKAAMSALVV